MNVSMKNANSLFIHVVDTLEFLNINLALVIEVPNVVRFVMESNVMVAIWQINLESFRQSSKIFNVTVFKVVFRRFTYIKQDLSQRACFFVTQCFGVFWETGQDEFLVIAFDTRNFVLNEIID